ncbi:MAG: hypothetical protein KDD94_10570, partial [Calditrichaeota bacterium]|nr:hypothetical protein [Calditrichota bacterium]
MFRFLMTALFSQVVFSQFQISKKDTTYVYNLNSFRGTGLNPSPTDQLDSDDWATAGISGTTAFGATNTDAALSRGATTGGVGNTGGLYAYHVSGSSHYAILIRPTNSVFNTGSITLRVENNTSEPIVNLRFAYDIRVNNNNNHSHSLNFSYSTDNSTYTSISALNYSSPQASDGNGVVFAATKKDTITNLYIAAGGYVYLRWSGANVSGNGQYDELIL